MDQRFQELRSAAETTPNNVDAQLAFAQHAMELGKVREPYEALSRALEAAPTDPRVQLCTAEFLLDQEQYKDAYSLFESVADAGFIDGLAGMVAVRERRGDLPGAMSLLTANQEVLGCSLTMVMQTASVLRRTGQVEEAFELLSEVPTEVVTGPAAVPFLLLLGDIEAQRGHYGSAAEAYGAANRLRDVQFDREGLQTLLHSQVAAYQNAARFAELPKATPETPTPVFIVGAPCTGTHLLEQILAAHSAVAPAGELEDLRDLVTRVDSASPTDIDSAGSQYIARLRTVGPFSRYVTDNRPHNLFHLGFLAQLAPAARVLWCRRGHRDTALSIFTKNLHRNHDYATDLRAIGQYLSTTEAMMDHWRQCLPLAIHEIQYETLVANPLDTLQSTMRFLNLDWEPRLLDFHKGAQAAKSGSYAKIRQPLHRRSVGKAEPYLPHLPALTDLPAAPDHRSQAESA